MVAFFLKAAWALEMSPDSFSAFWVWCLNLRPEVHLEERPAYPQTKAYLVEFSKDLVSKIWEASPEDVQIKIPIPPFKELHLLILW